MKLVSFKNMPGEIYKLINKKHNQDLDLWRYLKETHRRLDDVLIIKREIKK